MPVVIILTALISSFSQATVTVGVVDCPVQFEGRAKQFIESVGTSRALSTQTVIFENLKTLKGNLPDSIPVEVLESGPIKIERGEDYRVQLRDGRVCSIEKL